MLISVGERISLRALPRWRSTTSATRRSRSPARRPGSSPTRCTAKAKIVEVRAQPHPRRARRRTGSCSSPASRASRPTLDVTTLGRGGSDTTARRARGRARRRRLRDLHRRRRRLHRRPADRPGRAQAPTPSATTRCSRWRRRAREVLQLRSVEFARNHDVRLHVRSTFATPRARGSARRTTGCSRRRSSPASRTRASETRVPACDRRRRRRAVFARARATPSVNVDTIVQTRPTRSSSPLRRGSAPTSSARIGARSASTWIVCATTSAKV